MLDDDEIMYYPPAFSPDSRAVLRELYPDAIVAADLDAEVFGLNAVSDGRHVVLPQAATVDNRGIPSADEYASGMTIDDLVGDIAALIEH